MPIRVFCSCCGETMRDIRPQDIDRLSGKEMCASCQEKFESVRAQLDKTHAVILRKLEVLYKNAKQDLNSLLEESKRGQL